MSDHDDGLTDQWRSEAVADASKEFHAKPHEARGDRYAVCGCVFSPAAQDEITKLRAAVRDLAEALEHSTQNSRTPFGVAQGQTRLLARHASTIQACRENPDA